MKQNDNILIHKTDSAWWKEQETNATENNSKIGQITFKWYWNIS
jgi:hypothetical protein